jgi:hypothetical protein
LAIQQLFLYFYQLIVISVKAASVSQYRNPGNTGNGAVPNRRRFWHVDVIGDSKCWHVWRGRGNTGDVGVRQAAEKQGS